MNKFFELMILAIMMSSLCGCAQTVEKKITYVIDEQVVENFDGSQLVGKTIGSYKINPETNTHGILTTEFIEKSHIVSYSPTEVVFVIDGAIVDANVGWGKIRNVKKTQIGDIRIIKDSEDEIFKRYSNDSTKLVWYVTTK